MRDQVLSKCLSKGQKWELTLLHLRGSLQHPFESLMIVSSLSTLDMLIIVFSQAIHFFRLSFIRSLFETYNHLDVGVVISGISPTHSHFIHSSKTRVMAFSNICCRFWQSLRVCPNERPRTRELVHLDHHQRQHAKST